MSPLTFDRLSTLPRFTLCLHFSKSTFSSLSQLQIEIRLRPSNHLHPPLSITVRLSTINMQISPISRLRYRELISFTLIVSNSTFPHRTKLILTIQTYRKNEDPPHRSDTHPVPRASASGKMSAPWIRNVTDSSLVVSRS